MGGVPGVFTDMKTQGRNIEDHFVVVTKAIGDELSASNE